MCVCVCVCVLCMRAYVHEDIFHYRSINLGETPRVKTAASMFHKICYGNRDGLVAGIICAGWDPVDGGQVSEGVGEWMCVCCVLCWCTGF